jgi:predicted DNA-binding transcriptional regulator AlpA
MRVLRRRATEAKCGLSKTALYDKIQNGKFPKAELDQWLADRIAERDSLPSGRGE